MAKSQYTLTHSVIDKLTVKGILSDGGTAITYLDEEKIERKVKVADCFDIFKGQVIELSIVAKNSDFENVSE